MNLIFVKNLGFSIVCERFPIYISGEGEADHVLPSFIENGAPPHLLEARCARRLSAVALFASSSEFVCSYIGGNSSRSFSGAGGYHDPLHWYRLCAVMGTRQRFPEVRTAFGAYPTTFAKCLVGILRCSNGD